MTQNLQYVSPKLTLPIIPEPITHCDPETGFYTNPLERSVLRQLCNALINGVFESWNPTQPAQFFVERLHLTAKADYIAFRTDLKSLINLFAAEQRPLKNKMRQYGGDGMSHLHKNRNALVITTLIAIRRAGKIWSAAEAKKNQDLDISMNEVTLGKVLCSQ